MQEDVTAVKAAVQANTQQISAAATAQAQGFEEFQRAFAQLQTGQGTPVANPKSPRECCSNARLYQLRGDTDNAIRANQCHFGYGLEFVDAYDEYIALLNATQGIARTRQLIDHMQRAPPDSLVLQLEATRLLDTPEERVGHLIALAARAAIRPSVP